MNIPATLRSGDTWAWTESLPDYPATTYTLKYSFYHHEESVNTITAVADGSDYSVGLSAVDSAKYKPREWHWTACVEKGTGATLERKTVGAGTVEVKPGLANVTAGMDLRSHAQKVLDAINATLEGRATQAQASITVNGKAVSYMRPDELLNYQAVYQRRVDKEKAKERGEGGSTITRIQF